MPEAARRECFRTVFSIPPSAGRPPSPSMDLEQISFLLISFGCVLMLAGFTARNHPLGPWVILLGVVVAIGTIGYDILAHTSIP